MSGITEHLAKAQAEFDSLDAQLTTIARKHEIAKVRLETLQMVAGEDLSEPAVTTAAPGRPARTTIRTIKPSQPRAAAGTWRTVFSNLIAKGLNSFSYDDVVQAAHDIALDAPKASARVRVSKFKDQGYLERVTDGVYKPTKKGMDFFKP